jgi:hypothetical protein
MPEWRKIFDAEGRESHGKRYQSCSRLSRDSGKRYHYRDRLRSGRYHIIQAGTSITVSNVSVSSSTTITATFTIQNSADAGGNWNVTVTSGGQTSTSKTFFVQIPTSLNVISVNLIANGANGGCKSTDYGIHVDVKYQVQDQNTHAIQSAAMIPQESVNGSGWGDILTTFYTNGNRDIRRRTARHMCN